VVYGFTVPERARGRRAGEYLERAFRGRPVVGDRVRLGGVELVARETADGKVTAVSLLVRQRPPQSD
jgi:cell volume regulation protein A